MRNINDVILKSLKEYFNISEQQIAGSTNPSITVGQTVLYQGRNMRVDSIIPSKPANIDTMNQYSDIKLPQNTEKYPLYVLRSLTDPNETSIVTNLSQMKLVPQNNVSQASTAQPSTYNI